MSDSVREAFEKWIFKERGIAAENCRHKGGYLSNKVGLAWSSYQAALSGAQQGEVPELADKVRELCNLVEENALFERTTRAVRCARLISEVEEMLTAAPSGDAKREAEIKAVQAFKEELVKSVSPLFKPHIEGVCAVVTDRLRQSSDGDDSEEETHG